MIKAVLFDLDGLLIDSEVIYYRMIEELAGSAGYSFSLDDYVHNYSGKTVKANMVDYIERFHLSVSLEEGIQWILKREAELTKDGIPLKPGARSLIRYLKNAGIKMILATSSLSDRAERFLKLAGVFSDFDDFVYGSEVEHGKPDPETFLTGARKAGEAPAECLVLEDSENGVRAAYAGGFPVICVPDLKRPSPEVASMASAVVGSLEDVIPIIETLQVMPGSQP